MPRELTRPVHVGGVQIGGGAPVVVQSMTCTDTADAQATLAQVRALAQAGCDIVRVSVPTEAALEGFRTICAESPVPIVADIHFNHKLAIGAVEAGAAKLRINPGNIGDWAKVDAVIDAAGAAAVRFVSASMPVRLSRISPSATTSTQPEKLVMSSERFVKHFEDRGFTNIVLSAKAHSVQTTLDTYRALSRDSPRSTSLGRNRGRYQATGHHQELGGPWYPAV
ncbi:MAG: flavodoxin-dependent (E)-4-hydroxy-3-methylbut-2-enyl-diphosphate synthase [Collinsella sp.]